MSYNKIKICNMAMNMLKSGGSVLDIDSPQTEEERVFNTWYDSVKNDCLRLAHYRDSIQRTTISADPQAPTDFTYKHKWKMPSDCVKLLGIGDLTQWDDYGYVVEGGYICLKQGYTEIPSKIPGNQNALDINIRYIKDIQEEDMSSDFARLLAYALAAEPGISVMMTENLQLVSNATAFFASQLKKFTSANMQENKPVVKRAKNTRIGQYSRFTKEVY